MPPRGPLTILRSNIYYNLKTYETIKVRYKWGSRPRGPLIKSSLSTKEGAYSGG